MPLLLQTVLPVLPPGEEGAGSLAPAAAVKSARGSSVGVFVGVGSSDYQVWHSGSLLDWDEVIQSVAFWIFVGLGSSDGQVWHCRPLLDWDEVIQSVALWIFVGRGSSNCQVWHWGSLLVWDQAVNRFCIGTHRDDRA